MQRLPIQITDHPPEKDCQTLEDNLNRFNMQLTGYHDYRPLATFLRDPDGTMIAGLSGFTWGGTLRIQVLWVDENWRGQGLGTQLLMAAEQEGSRRGCKQAVLETHSFQAPEFYARHGYSVCGTFEEYPVGYQQISFQKRLE